MNIKHIHMLGICGTGMGSLALLLKEAGYNITGSDENVYPPMSTQLAQAGINVLQGYSAENIAASPDLVIIGNVISRGNPEAEAVLSQGLKYMSMPQAVAEFFIEGKHSIVVAGTHGKTTTANLCAWMLDTAGCSPGFLIGGVGINFNVSARIGHPPYFVIEGDEYDTAFFDKGPKFLHYRPRSVILGPVEFDHADIYKDLPHVMGSFEKLIGIIPADGLLVACADSQNTLKLVANAKCRVITYGMKGSADYHPEDIHVSGEGTEFTLIHGGNPPKNEGSSLFPPFAKGGIYVSPLYGNHNMQNAVGVLAFLTEAGIEPKKLAQGLLKFAGVKRRQEIRGIKNGVVVVDDFAHHPTAIRETIEAMRMRYPKRSSPQRRIWAIFEPRSNTSRRKTFQDEFVTALGTADVAVLAGIHRPDKIPEDERLDITKVVADINNKGGRAHYLATTDDIVKFVAKEAKKDDIILIMSNGDFDNIHEKLLQAL